MLKQGGKTGNRGPSLKGKVMIDTVNGQERIRSWPRKRGHDLPAITKRQNDWFLQANWATKYLTSVEMVAATEAVEGTPMLPRDILLMAFAGRLFSYTREDGKVVYPMASLISVSQSLDILSSTPGKMLVRGPDLWEPVDAPTGNGGGGLNAICPQPRLRLEQHVGRHYNWVFGTPCYAAKSTVITGVSVPMWATSAGLMGRPCVYAANAQGYMGDLIATGPLTPMDKTQGVASLPFDLAATIPADTMCYVGFGCWGAADWSSYKSQENIYIRFFETDDPELPETAPAQSVDNSTSYPCWLY